jgi:hypothetical protein
MLGLRFQRSWQVACESYAVLRNNPSLVIFPILSGVATIIVSIPFLAILALPFLHQTGYHPHSVDPVHYMVTAGMYFANYFVIIFFNSALVACANENLQGRPTDVGFGIHAALQRLPQILGWALIASTVGMILRAISERTGIGGAIASAIAGLVWNVAVFFVVPCMVIERVGPIQAFKTSAAMIKQTWGERVILGIGVGSASAVLILASLIPAFVGIALLIAQLWIPAIILLVLGVISFLAAITVASAITTIYQTALYVYCRSGMVPNGFQAPSLQGAFAEKPQNRLFGGRGL